MFFFKKKSVRDYLTEPTFLKEYNLLLEERNQRLLTYEAPKKEEPNKVVEKKRRFPKRDETAKEEKAVEPEKVEKAVEAVEIKEVEKTVEPEKTIEVIEDEKIEVIEEPVKKVSFFDKLSSSLSKTKNNIIGKINEIISDNAKIDDDTLDDLEEALYTSDIGVKTTEQIIENIRQRVRLEKYEDTSALKTLIHEEIAKLVRTDDNLAKADFDKKPYVILVVGVNGNGKTTTIGKLSKYYKNLGKKVIVGAADTFRAAAIEQLEEWTKRARVEIVKQQINSDPAAVAYNTYQTAISRDADVVLIDTAGRLHNKINLMNELEKITKVLKKFDIDAPHEVLLVLDATTGQNAVSQAKQFQLSSGVSGLVLTKLDGTAKGGVAIAINQELKIPVKFIGVGEKIEDLQVFNVEEYVKAIFS